VKLLFDQNISFRIIKKIESIFSDSKQVRSLSLENASDLDIWEYSKINHFTIVTFDADFSDIANIKGNPPKIIWLRTGNTTTKNIVEILKNHHSIISEFIQNSEYNKIACLEITS
jgi:predicted nuclease of predicted toxin-antitoxin system